MSESLNSVQLEIFRKRLEAQLSEVIQRLLRHANDEERARLGPYNTNLLSYETFSEVLGASSQDRASEDLSQLNRIEASLSLFHMGLYGLCSDCEESLKIERLEQDPTLQRCDHCQQRHRKSMTQSQRTWL